MKSNDQDPKVKNGGAAATDLDLELKEAMQNLRPFGGKSTPAAKPAHKGSKKARSKAPNPTSIVAENETPEFKLKGELTNKEMRFIELYLTGDLTVDKAMESAGYEGYHKKSLYRLGRKIVEKYESQAADHRKIFRAIGAGEVAIAKGLLNLAQNAKSEMVKLNAWATIAKCMGLQRELVDVQTGISIVINANPQAPTEPGPGWWASSPGAPRAAQNGSKSDFDH